MDLFYYGSQDVPLPLRGGREAWSRPRELFCESCSAPVSGDDLTEGRASEVFGLVLCESCRDQTKAEDRVELHFCDRCQVSVPVFRVDTGEALSGDGRILCLSCRELVTRSLKPLLLVAFGLLVVVAGAALFLAGKYGEPERDASASSRVALDAVGERLERELGRWADPRDLDLGLEDAAQVRGALRTLRDRVLESIEGSRTSFLQTRAEFRRRMDLLEAEIAALERNVEALLHRAGAER